MEAYINGKRFPLDPKKSIGKGGEADVFLIAPDTALKIFKDSTHPDFNGNPIEQRSADLRLAEHQTKLKDFPKNLPPAVICPIELATKRDSRKVIGYTMKYIKDAEALIRYTDLSFRQGVPQQMILDIFMDLCKTISRLHDLGVVIGDFNDLDVLIKDAQAFLIDADSFQFSHYLCQMFTAKFVDPMLCDPNAPNLMLVKPYNLFSDWYSFSVMLFESLLYVDPYGGTYKPKAGAKKITRAMRPLHRITVFHPDVGYPKPATPLDFLPDDLLHFFQQVFEKDKREKFPIRLLENMHWTKCSNCGTEHAKNVCPKCAQKAPGSIRQTVEVHGKVRQPES